VAVLHLASDHGRGADEDPVLRLVEVTDGVVLVHERDIHGQGVQHRLQLIDGELACREPHAALRRRARFGTGNRGHRRGRSEAAVADFVELSPDLMPLPLRDHLKGGREEDAVLLEEVGGKPFPQGHGKLPEPSPFCGLDPLLELADLLVLVPQDPRWLHDPVLLHHGEQDVLLPQVVSLRLLEVLADVGQLLWTSLPLG